MKNKLIKILGILLWLAVPVTLFAAQPFNSAQLAPTPSNGNCLTTNGSINAWSSSCGSGGGGGSASTPFGGLQFSVPSGTSTAFSASSNMVYSTTTSILSILNSSTTNATSTNFYTRVLSLGASAISYIQGLFSATTPIVDTAGVISCNTASGSQAGCLSSTDWNTFNGKGSGNGSVTSVAMTTPTGLSISGSPITTSGTLGLTLTSGYTIPLTASTTMWQSAYSSTTALNATAPIVYNGSTGNISCPTCGSGSGGITTIPVTTNFWIDGNYTGATTTGSIQYPFKTLTAAATFISASSSITSAVLNMTPILSNGAYTEQTLSMPNIPLIIHGNGATIIMLNGGNLGGGTLTLSNDLNFYDAVIFGNVVESDSSQTNPHTFTDAFIAGNLTAQGVFTYNDGATVDQNKILFPFLSNSASSTITMLPNSLTNFTGDDLQTVIVNTGTINLDDDNLAVATSTAYALTSTSTGSTVDIVGLSLENFGTGGGIDILNGASTTPNVVSNMGIIMGGNSASTNGIYCGNASCVLKNYTITTLTGNQLYATASTSALIAGKDSAENVDGSSLFGAQGGTTTVADYFLASSTVQFSSLTGSTQCLHVSTTGLLSGTGSDCGSGTVTSVAMTVPTGLSVSGSPITTSGTLGLTLTSGYNIPLTASTTQWASAYASTTALSGTSPIVYTGSTGVISCPTCQTGSPTNFFTNSGATTTLTTGSILTALTGTFGTINATSTTGTSTFSNAATFGGNVGIGTTSPGAILTVAGNTSVANILSVTGGTGISGVQGQNISLATGNGLGSISAFGGDFTVSTGAGVTGSGSGRGGNMAFTLGNGGSNSGPVTAGAGGSFSLIAGNGGNSSSVAPPGAGGAITFTSGNAGTVSSGNGANGGNIIFMPGTGSGTGVSGNVGIGTTTPLYGLTIATDTDIDNGLFHASTTASVITINTLQEGAPVFQTDSGVVTALDEPVDTSATVGTLESYSFNSGGTPVMTVYGLSSGAGATTNLGVGIGTTTPASPLDVNGNVTIEKANGIIMRDTVTGSCYIIKVTSGVLVPTASTTAAC